MSRMLRLENPLKNSEHRRLEHHPRHFAIPSNSMQHFVDIVIHLISIFIELLQQDQQGLDDLHVGES